MTQEIEQQPVTTEKPKPIPVTDIPVVCYELGPFDPAEGKPPKAEPMRPSPLESFKGRWGRVEDKNGIRDMLTAKGHELHAVNWGERPDGTKCLLVYIWAKRAAPPKPPSKPQIPPPRPRRSATSRRHAPKPESRKKP
jgi:hypothetical protein